MRNIQYCQNSTYFVNVFLKKKNGLPVTTKLNNNNNSRCFDLSPEQWKPNLT